MTEPNRLPSAAREIIEDRTVQTYASAASAYELGFKFRRGNLQALASIMTGYRQHVRRVVSAELDLSADHALAAASLDWAHRDPFDRMLAAQSVIEGLTLITSDPALRNFDLVTTLW